MKRRRRNQPTPQISRTLLQPQKKTAQIGAEISAQQPEADDISPEIIAAISSLIAARKRESQWLVPVIVVMVVGATIYISILQGKAEYVYSLASASFGYYFGQLGRKYQLEPEKPTERL